ncbi:MAG: hypothetical protein J2P55_05900 [Rhizobiales bacterium]|nr:hypothetical protein [Hyphomicrobiales bacterium]
MARLQTTRDLVSNLVLAGAAAMILVRPTLVARAARLLALPRAKEPARQASRRLSLRPAPPPSPLQQLALLAPLYSRAERRRRQQLTRTAGRRLNGSAAMLAFSVFADSAIEHYRGLFHNRAMYVPLAVSALTLGGSLFGAADARPKKHLARDGIYAAAAATAFAGLGFHFYNILKRPGGWSWLNLFYSAPIGAPMALALAGFLGRCAERVRNTSALARPNVLGLPAGRMLAGMTAAGLAGTVGEAGLLHFRGAYHNPAMFLPVSVPPIASVLVAATALRPSRARKQVARWWLRLTALLGFAGVGFHAYGVARNMGGWRNWSQNVLNGPPLPAPPSFTGLALAGLAALSLIEEESQEQENA